MILNRFLGKETLTTEFKELAFKTQPSYYFTEEEIQSILNGKWNIKLSSVILQEIDKTINIYIPKYIACFLNAQLNGTIIFGVDDTGYIKGIPSKIQLTRELILPMIIQTINQNVKINNKSQFISQNLDIKIEELEIDPDIVDDNISALLDKYQKTKNKYEREMRIYCMRKQEWLNELDKCRSLELVVNTPNIKNGLIKYIKKRINNNNIIAQLESSDNIIIPSGYELDEYKKENTNIYYWIMNYKDYLIDGIRQKKPIKPINLNKRTLSSLLTKISNLNGKFIKDTTIKFYLIIVNINGKNNNEKIYYKLPDTQEWLYRSRTLIKGEPSCVCF